MRRWLLILAILVVLSVGAGYWGVTGINPARKVADVVVRLSSSEDAKIAKLQQPVQDALNGLIQDLADAGMTVFVGQTLRTIAEEVATNDDPNHPHSAVSAPNHSWHVLGRAVDLYPINPDTGKADLAGTRTDLFQQMATAAEARGFTSLAFNADGTKRILHTKTGHAFWDGGHLEFHGPYSTIDAALDAEGATYGVT